MINLKSTFKLLLNKELEWHDTGTFTLCFFAYDSWVMKMHKKTMDITNQTRKYTNLVEQELKNNTKCTICNTKLWLCVRKNIK